MVESPRVTKTKNSKFCSTPPFDQILTPILWNCLKFFVTRLTCMRVAFEVLVYTIHVIPWVSTWQNNQKAHRKAQSKRQSYRHKSSFTHTQYNTMVVFSIPYAFVLTSKWVYGMRQTGRQKQNTEWYNARKYLCCSHAHTKECVGVCVCLL